jgi:hypothetical protein
MAHHSMPRTGLLTGAHHAWKIEIIPVASPVSLICREAVEQPAGALKPILATVARGVGRVPSPSMAVPTVLEVQFLQVMSLPGRNAFPSGCEPVSISRMLGVSSRPLTTAPFSVRAARPNWPAQKSHPLRAAPW